jgi:colanic acid biosynthesis glycosyl transferase WcaI
MKILLVTDAYPPEIRSASHLMQELAEELRDRGHSVIVATCHPKYNLPDASPLADFDELTFENGIQIVRISTLPHHKVNFFIRGISQLTLPLIFWLKLKPYLKDGVDAVLVYSPPLPLWQVGFRAKRIHGARFILNVQDIFPQNAIDLGALRNPILIRFFERIERAAYSKADIVTVHSKSNKEFLIREKAVPSDKVVTLHNWVDMKNDEQAVVSNEFRKRWGLEDKFIFFFGGVMGPSQGLDLLIGAANMLKEIKDIVILLMGDGTEKERLQELARHHALGNMVFYPFVSKEDYQLLVKEVNVGLVCLTSKNKTPVVPGKILGYMAAGIPVLAFLNKESDGHQLIQDAKCGYSEVSDGVNKAADLMLQMYQGRDRLQQLGLNGYSFAAQHFSKKVCVDQLEQLMQP